MYFLLSDLVPHCSFIFETSTNFTIVPFYSWDWNISPVWGLLSACVGRSVFTLGWKAHTLRCNSLKQTLQAFLRCTTRRGPSFFIFFLAESKSCSVSWSVIWLSQSLIAAMPLPCVGGTFTRFQLWKRSKYSWAAGDGWELSLVWLSEM